MNKAKDSGYAPLHTAVERGHIDVAIFLVESGLADSTARTRRGRLQMDLATNTAMRQAIVNEETRRRDHGYKRAVIPNPTAAELANMQLLLGGDDEGQGQGQAIANAVAENVGQGQGSASASAVAEEDDDDSGSDEPHEEAYWRSLKRKRSKES